MSSVVEQLTVLLSVGGSLDMRDADSPHAPRSPQPVAGIVAGPSAKQDPARDLVGLFVSLYMH